MARGSAAGLGPTPGLPLAAGGGVSLTAGGGGGLARQWSGGSVGSGGSGTAGALDAAARYDPRHARAVPPANAQMDEATKKRLKCVWA